MLPNVGCAVVQFNPIQQQLIFVGVVPNDQPQSIFTSGLSALISQVGNGSSLTNLQNTFTQSSSHPQSANASRNASSASTTSTGSSSAANVNPQALLTQLQHNIGDSTSNFSNTCNFLHLVANLGEDGISLSVCQSHDTCPARNLQATRLDSGARYGIGLLINVVKGSSDAAGMYAAIVIIMVVALAAEYAMTLIESRLAKWRPAPLVDNH